ncbi:hypothetical protein [Metallosphaera hakonensis]|uniref:Uncharacterized protein n=1 Tax=Metallosphaera hakonensis JCM 8857 = DSM 7519 TaxID=1293036 RepID=A0A2U9IUW8_9CREN|nr:hypothetical protein [Metallosphaera hakonensis]AWR99891.1 hypothetical protein DFR87_09550 [Metallosphaera hakonensis JCM 8857 = DSM 7519]
MTVTDGVSVTETSRLKLGSMSYLSSSPNDPAWDIVYTKLCSHSGSIQPLLLMELHFLPVPEHYENGGAVKQEPTSVEV